MMRNYITCLWAVIVMFTISTSSAYAYGDTFSCSFGKQPACLDYGDKVCSSRAKCVSNDAVCFESYTCDYKGFVCKSKFDELADEYDGLLNKCRNIASEHDELVDDYNELLRKYKDIQICVSYASTLDEARSCY